MEFEELVAHLDDLILVAVNEGFPRFAGLLLAARARTIGSYDLFSRRHRLPDDGPPVDPDSQRAERFLKNVRDS